MKPNEDMVDLFNDMIEDERYDCYILSTSPWNNPTLLLIKWSGFKNTFQKLTKD